jgi:hypothetical protein
MATSGKGTGIVGYNVQTAVDVEHHLIVAHEVTNVGHDRTQLIPMALKAQEETGNQEITVLADRGYFNGDQVLACENTGVLPCIPKTLTSSSAKRGLFSRQDFVYDATQDHYTCPAGEHLTRGLVRSDRRGDIDQYGDSIIHFPPTNSYPQRLRLSTYTTSECIVYCIVGWPFSQYDKYHWTNRKCYCCSR